MAPPEQLRLCHTSNSTTFFLTVSSASSVPALADKTNPRSELSSKSSPAPPCSIQFKTADEQTQTSGSSAIHPFSLNPTTQFLHSVFRLLNLIQFKSTRQFSQDLRAAVSIAASTAPINTPTSRRRSFSAHLPSQSGFRIGQQTTPDTHTRTYSTSFGDSPKSACKKRNKCVRNYSTTKLSLRSRIAYGQLIFWPSATFFSALK